MAIDWTGMWQELNVRQQLFLQLLYERERQREVIYTSQDYSRSPLRKGGEWRWIDHQGDLCHLLYHRHQLTDPGEGSTWKALDDRGFVERRWRDVKDCFGRMHVILSVRLTRRGRQLLREKLRREVPEPVAQPLPEWAHLSASLAWPETWRSGLERIPDPLNRAACIRLLYSELETDGFTAQGFPKAWCFLSSVREQLVQWLEKPKGRRYRQPLSPRQFDTLVGLWAKTERKFNE